MEKLTLAAMRVNAGYTQAGLARFLNVTQGAVSSWERGDSYPRVGTAKKMSDLYGVTLDAIYSAKPQQKNS
jgi:DNA-binding XRE family transcriptional regulator